MSADGREYSTNLSNQIIKGCYYTSFLQLVSKTGWTTGAVFMPDDFVRSIEVMRRDVTEME